MNYQGGKAITEPFRLFLALGLGEDAHHRFRSRRPDETAASAGEFLVDGCDLREERIG